MIAAMINDCIATQRYPTPEIMIGSTVMSSATSEPSGGRSRIMVAIVAGCRSFRTFRDCHCIHDRRTATKFCTHIRIDMGLIRTYKKLTQPTTGGILGGQKFKSPENVMNCPEKKIKPHPRGVQVWILGGQNFNNKSPGNAMDCPEKQYFF